jgi:hypothetical protein
LSKVHRSPFALLHVIPNAPGVWRCICGKQVIKSEPVKSPTPVGKCRRATEQIKNPRTWKTAHAVVHLHSFIKNPFSNTWTK